MKYLFIILIAFSFIGCEPCDCQPNEEDVNPNKTVYATFTLLSNPDDIIELNVNCAGLFQLETGAVSLPVGTTLTTEPHLTFGYNVLCGVAMESPSNPPYTGPNCEVEIKLYVNDELFETRVVTGSNVYNFIIP